MNNQQRDQPQSNIFYIPRLSEYADAISRVMHELKNIGASPEQIISLLKGDSRPPDNTDTDEMKVEVDIEIEADIPVTPTAPVKYPHRMYTAYQIARELGIYSMYCTFNFIETDCAICYIHPAYTPQSKVSLQFHCTEFLYAGEAGHRFPRFFAFANQYFTLRLNREYINSLRFGVYL